MPKATTVSLFISLLVLTATIAGAVFLKPKLEKLEVLDRESSALKQIQEETITQGKLVQKLSCLSEAQPKFGEEWMKACDDLTQEIGPGALRDPFCRPAKQIYEPILQEYEKAKEKCAKE